MTTKAELRRRIRAIKAEEAAHPPVDPRTIAVDRVQAGNPTDEDLEILLDEDVYRMVLTVSGILGRSKQSRQEQQETAPAFRLLANVTEGAKGPDRDVALHALRELAQFGRYENDNGWRRSTPEQQGIARLYLRALLRWLPYRDEMVASGEPMDPADLVRPPAKPAKPADY